MNKTPSIAPSEAINMEIDEESEDIIELTEIVEDEEQEDATTVLSPKELHQNLKKELLYIGGMIQEWRILEDYILTKVEISNELYVSTYAMEGRKIDEKVAAIREGIHLVLKGQEESFYVLGNNWMNDIEPFIIDIGYSNIENADQFFGLNADLQRRASKANERKIRQRRSDLGTTNS